jgi:transposase
MSRNAAARRFGVSIASAVRWMDAYLRTACTAPRPRGTDASFVAMIYAAAILNLQ